MLIEILFLKVVPVHAMKVVCGVEVQGHSFLVSAPDAGKRSASHHDRFISREGASGTHSVRGRGATETVWTIWVREKSYALPGVQPRFFSPPSHGLGTVLNALSRRLIIIVVINNNNNNNNNIGLYFMQQVS